MDALPPAFTVHVTPIIFGSDNVNLWNNMNATESISEDLFFYNIRTCIDKS